MACGWLWKGYVRYAQNGPKSPGGCHRIARVIIVEKSPPGSDLRSMRVDLPLPPLKPLRQVNLLLILTGESMMFADEAQV